MKTPIEEKIKLSLSWAQAIDLTNFVLFPYDYCHFVTKKDNGLALILILVIALNILHYNLSS